MGSAGQPGGEESVLIEAAVWRPLESLLKPPHCNPNVLDPKRGRTSSETRAGNLDGFKLLAFCFPIDRCVHHPLGVYHAEELDRFE